MRFLVIITAIIFAPFGLHRNVLCQEITIDTSNIKTVPLNNQVNSPQRAENRIEHVTFLNRAMSLQLKCDSIAAGIESLQNILETIDNEYEHQSISKQITNDKSKLQMLREEVDRNYELAAHKRYKDNKKSKISDIMANSYHYIYLQKEINNIKKYAYKPIGENELFQITNSNTKKIIEGDFNILEHSPYSNNSPIPEIQHKNDILVYRIQLGAFKNKMSANAFGGLSPLEFEKVKDSEITKYYAGLFYTLKEARMALTKIKGYGFSDAFIIPFFKANKISIHRAKELEFGEKN